MIISEEKVDDSCRLFGVRPTYVAHLINTNTQNVGLKKNAYMDDT